LPTAPTPYHLWRWQLVAHWSSSRRLKAVSYPTPMSLALSSWMLAASHACQAAAGAKDVANAALRSMFIDLDECLFTIWLLTLTGSSRHCTAGRLPRTHLTARPSSYLCDAMRCDAMRSEGRDALVAFPHAQTTVNLITHPHLSYESSSPRESAGDDRVVLQYEGSAEL
jgi:hypothetical protein